MPDRRGRTHSISVSCRGRSAPLPTALRRTGTSVGLTTSHLAPQPPRRAIRLPQFLKHHLVTKGVHRLPEAVMLVGPQFAIPSECLQRSRLPRRLVSLDPVDDRWIEHEESTVDVGIITGRLLD